MQNDEFRPVNHSTMGAATSTIGQAAGQGLKSGAKAAIGWTGIIAIAGAGLGLFLGLAATGVLPIGLMFGGEFAAAAFGKALLIGTLTVGGGIAGLIGGGVTSPFAGILGGAFGAGKGAVEGSRRVSQEQGHYNAASAQLAAMQAEAASQMAQVQARAPQTNISISGPAHSIQGDSAQYDGKIDANLALARA